MAKSSLVEFGDYTDDDAEEDMNEQKQSRGGGFFKFPEGKSTLRFVPPPVGKKWKVAVMEHFFDIPGVGSVKFVCPKHASKGKRKCPACSKVAKLLATGEPADETNANNMKAKRRCYTKAIVRKEEAQGLRIVAFGPMVEGELTALRNGGYNFVHPTEGCDIVVIKTVKGGRTEYKCMAANKGAELPLSDDVDQMNEWIQGAGDLDKFARVYSDEQIAQLMRGERIERERAPAAGRKPAPSRGSIGDEMDDDDEDEDESDEDEDEEISF